MTGAPHHLPQQAFYRACIKEAAAHGEAMMHGTLERALRDMPGQAAQAADPAERAMITQAASALLDHQHAFVEGFPAALLTEFAHTLAGDRGSSLAFDSLPLLGEEQVLDNMSVLRAAQDLQQAVQRPWEQLEPLLAAAQGGSPAETKRQPLRPEVYVNALYRLTRQRVVPAGVRRRWVRQLALAMAPELARSYDSLVQLLRAQGLAPAPLAPDADARREADRATQLTIRELQRLLAGDRPSSDDTSRFAHTEFSTTVPAAFEMLQDMRKVDQVIQRLRQRQAAMPGSEADERAAFREALRQEAKRPAQALGLEVVHLMVENMAEDPRLLPPVRNAVRDLEPVLLRLALEDPRFFSDRSHPARQLLEQVTERSLAWSDTAAEGFAEFFDSFQQAVEALLETRTPGTQAFDIALQTLQEAWDGAHPRARRAREKAVRALLRAEQRNLLAERIAGQISQRRDAADAPPEALAFLTGPWAQVLAQARLTDSSAAEDPGGYGWVVQAVLWSVQPALIGRVAGQHRQLVERIQAGLATIDHLPAETRRWQSVLAELRRAAAAAVLGSPAPASDPSPPPPAVHTWLAPLEIYDSGFVPDPAMLSGVEAGPSALPPIELQAGAWVDLHNGEAWERWQLTWASPHGLLFMFTHANGSTRSMTRRKLQQMLGEESLRLVSAQAVIDGALDAVARAAWRNSV